VTTLIIFNSVSLHGGTFQQFKLGSSSHTGEDGYHTNGIQVLDMCYSSTFK